MGVCWGKKVCKPKKVVQKSEVFKLSANFKITNAHVMGLCSLSETESLQTKCHS